MSVYNHLPFPEKDAKKLALAMGELAFSWGRLEDILKSLEMQKVNKQTKAKFINFNVRIEKLFGKNDPKTIELKRLAKLRNFIFHNPLSAIKKAEDSEIIPIIVHQDISHTSILGGNKIKAEKYHSLYADEQNVRTITIDIMVLYENLLELYNSNGNNNK